MIIAPSSGRDNRPPIYFVYAEEGLLQQTILYGSICRKLLYFRQREKRLENAKKRGFQPEKSGGSPAVADSAAVYRLDIYGKNVCRILSPKARKPA